MSLSLLLDLLLFKLAFHTYEALANKQKLVDRKEAAQTAKEGKENGGTEQKDGPAASGAPKSNHLEFPQDTASDSIACELDLASNMSDETTMTMGGPAGPMREAKIERVGEQLDVKLNQYLMKWMVVIIFYQTTWLWDILGWVLPAMPAVKLFLACWIMLPQLQGEFFLYHMLRGYILKAEKFLLGYRRDLSSLLVSFLYSLALAGLECCLADISSECIESTVKSAESLIKTLRNEQKERGGPSQTNGFFDGAENAESDIREIDPYQGTRAGGARGPGGQYQRGDPYRRQAPSQGPNNARSGGNMNRNTYDLTGQYGYDEDEPLAQTMGQPEWRGDGRSRGYGDDPGAQGQRYQEGRGYGRKHQTVAYPGQFEGGPGVRDAPQTNAYLYTKDDSYGDDVDDQMRRYPSGQPYAGSSEFDEQRRYQMSQQQRARQHRRVDSQENLPQGQLRRHQSHMTGQQPLSASTLVGNLRDNYNGPGGDYEDGDQVVEDLDAQDYGDGSPVKLGQGSRVDNTMTSAGASAQPAASQRKVTTGSTSAATGARRQAGTPSTAATAERPQRADGAPSSRQAPGDGSSAATGRKEGGVRPKPSTAATSNADPKKRAIVPPQTGASGAQRKPGTTAATAGAKAQNNPGLRK